jgi:hypothetical protein
MNPLACLYPRPRLFRLTGGSAVMPGRAEPIEQEREQPRPAGWFRVELSPRGALHARAADADGRASARAVLDELTAHAGETCSGFVVEDHPAYPVRGVMLDVSRCRVPTMQHFDEIIGVLARLRYNHVQLYVEHTFQYRGHEEVSQPWSPLTPEQIAELDRRCAEHGIELAANQNCFGHLSQWLAHPRYSALAETHGPYDFYGLTRDGPFSLCPIDPGSLELVADWLAQLRGCFTSRWVNIGCDETADVGAGRSAQAVRDRGKADVYAGYVSRVAQRARDLGLRPMFWADIALEHPQALGQLPDDLLALAWGYEPDTDFAGWAATLGAHGRPFWVCPGTSCWRSFTGRTRERRGNLAAAANAPGASGLLVTAWGDLGHRQQWPVTLHALADAAETAWHGDRARPDPAAAAAFVFGAASLGPWLDELGDADAELRAAHPGCDAVLRNASACFDELHPARPGSPRRGDARAWRAVHDRLEDLRRRMPEADPATSAELHWTLDMAAFACQTALARRTASAGPGLAGMLGLLCEGHRALWMRRSRPGGLEQSLAFMRGLAPAAEPVP